MTLSAVTCGGSHPDTTPPSVPGCPPAVIRNHSETMSFLENLEGFLPNVSVTESPGAIVFPSRRLWDELKTKPDSLLLLGPAWSQPNGPKLSTFVINMCILGGIKLEPADGILRGNFRSDMRWTFEALAWNPEDFEGLQQLRVPRTSIWTRYLYSTEHNTQNRRSEVVLESHFNGSKSLLEVRSVVDTFPGMWPCTKTRDPFPFDGFHCSVNFTISYSMVDDVRDSWEQTCGDRKLRKRYGEFELVTAPEFHPNDYGAGYLFKFIRNTDRIRTTVVRPTACLTILNAFSYRVTRWRVSYCCLLLISSTIISMSLFKEVHAKTHRIPQIVLLLFSSTLSISVGLALAILSESVSHGGRKRRKFEPYSKWTLLIPSALIFAWLMIQ